MDALPPVPPGGRCHCGAALWYVRAVAIGADGLFECRRCQRRYRPQESRWSPYLSASTEGPTR